MILAMFPTVTLFQMLQMKSKLSLGSARFSRLTPVQAESDPS